MNSIGILIAVGIALAAVYGGISVLTRVYNLDRIKAKTVGDGQHGTARWARPDEIKRTYKHIPYTPERWRKEARAGRVPTTEDGKPLPQGLVVGGHVGRNPVAFVDDSDIPALMIGAAGVGKTAYFLYPNLEYACAAGMSFLTSDTKGDLYRTYGKIAEKYYGYKVSVIDLRNPTRSNGNNLLHLVNKYMDMWLAEPDRLAYKAKAEKYAKIISKTIITSGSDGNFGQNAFFYDAAEGLLTATILLVSEFCPPETRHIVSVFKVIQELLAPSKIKGRSQFQVLLDKLPPEHKAKWFAGSALNSSEQAMASVMSTALSRLNAFLDSEMEQILCFDTAIDAEQFCTQKSALFLVMPEEDNTKYFMVSLIVQQLYREILAVADEQGGKLKNRVMFYLDEFGTIPKIESAEMMFSASRSRRLSIVAIIQSFAQLTKNYGKEGGEIITDNTQITVFGGFAPNSESAEILSRALGTKTVQSGSVSMGKDQPSQSLQMMERALMTPDELKSLPKGTFIVTKTGFFPMQVHLKLFFEWGIQFDKDPYAVPEQGSRAVAYADRKQLEEAIKKKYPPTQDQIRVEAEEEQRREERFGRSEKTKSSMHRPRIGSAGKSKQSHRRQLTFSEAYSMAQKGGME